MKDMVYWDVKSYSSEKTNILKAHTVSIFVVKKSAKQETSRNNQQAVTGFWLFLT
jgi:hypothetical protein